MAFELKSLAAALGLKSADATITEANLKQANDTIEALERDKTGAEQRAQTAEASLASMTTRATTAETNYATAQASLTTAQNQVVTLEKFKAEHSKAKDGRTEDESNKFGDEQEEPKAAFESAADAQIARVKRRVGTDKK